MSENNRRSGKTVDHFIAPSDKRAERHLKDVLKRPHDTDEDWDEYDFTPREHRYKKNHRME